MKRLLFCISLILPMLTNIGCGSVANQKNDEEIISEQILIIDSLLTSNVPLTTNSYRLGEIEHIVIVGYNMIYKNDEFNYIMLSARTHSYTYGVDEGYGIILPLEVKELCSAIDSMYQCTLQPISHNQLVSFGTKGGVALSVDNSESRNWIAKIKLSLYGKVEISLTPQQLIRFKNVILKNYDETKGYSNFNLLTESEARALQKEKEYFQKLKSDPEIIFTESGLAYIIHSKSNGKRPGKSNSVTFSYKGRLIDGTVFDESDSIYARINGLIKGFKEGILLMGVGDRATLYIPSVLGYGNTQVSDNIPPNSTLIYDVELLNIK